MIIKGKLGVWNIFVIVQNDIKIKVTLVHGHNNEQVCELETVF